MDAEARLQVGAPAADRAIARSTARDARRRRATCEPRLARPSIERRTRARRRDRTAGVKTRDARDDDGGDGERDSDGERDGAGDDDDDEATTRDARAGDAGGDGDDRAM